MGKNNTVVVNLFGGPGAGKTTCAWEIASELKKRNLVVEYVPEYAKELVWDGQIELLNGTFENQSAVFKEQKRRIDRLIGKVDAIITDSPLLLLAAYIKEDKERFEIMAVAEHKKYNNFCLFINRGKVFEQEGRIHNLEQSEELDKYIKNILERNRIYYGAYYHVTMPTVVKNIQTTLKKLQGQKFTVTPEQIKRDVKKKKRGTLTI